MNKPVRVQLSRKKGWRMPENTVSVARPGRWGNPFTHPEMLDGTPDGETRARHHAVEDFRDWMEDNEIDASKLAGKNLACWCPYYEPCHADVLLELANKDASHA